jgi:hypothetical protein
LFTQIVINSLSKARVQLGLASRFVIDEAVNRMRMVGLFLATKANENLKVKTLTRQHVENLEM